jgi:hypothetical protein
MDTDRTAPSPRRRRASKPADEGRAATPGGQADKTTAPSVAAAGRAPESALETRRQGVRLSQATLASLDLQRGAIGRLDAREVSVAQGAIGAARSETLSLELGALGAAMANHAQISQAGVGTLLAGEARLGQSAVRSLVARDVVVERPSLVGVLVAQRVRGDVRVLLDWRGAAVFGVVFGLLARLGRGRG